MPKITSKMAFEGRPFVNLTAIRENVSVNKISCKSIFGPDLHNGPGHEDPSHLNIQTSKLDNLIIWTLFNFWQNWIAVAGAGIWWCAYNWILDWILTFRQIGWIYMEFAFKNGPISFGIFVKQIKKIKQGWTIHWTLFWWKNHKYNSFLSQHTF